MTDYDILHRMFKGALYQEIDLDAAARRLFREDAPNPLLDPKFSRAWLDLTAAPQHTLYGGYLEDRQFLHRGTYLDGLPAIHLGIDVWVDRGVSVYSPIEGVVCDSWDDPDTNGGWGGRLTLATPVGRLVFAHMEETVWEVGEEVAMGEWIGHVADFGQNGGWTPHLHIQAVHSTVDLKMIDGYSTASSENEKMYPNPLSLLKEWNR